MIRKVNINGLTQVRNIVDIARLCIDDIGVHDQRGAIADAKSILGLMSLDYTKPVSIVSENEKELTKIIKAVS